MEVKRLREVYIIFLGWCEWPAGQSRSPEINGAWEDPGRGGDPGRPGGKPWAAGGEALGGRGGGRWAAGGEAGRVRGILLGSWNLPPGGLRGGDHASCAKWPKTEPKSLFSRGSRPGPLAGLPASQGDLDWLRRARFRVLLRATLLPDGCPVGVRRQVWTAQGGLKPP